MKGNRYAIVLLGAIAICLLAAPAMANDHGGAAWTPADDTDPTSCVSELATLTLMGCGLGALFGLVKFKNRRKR